MPLFFAWRLCYFTRAGHARNWHHSTMDITGIDIGHRNRISLQWSGKFSEGIECMGLISANSGSNSYHSDYESLLINYKDKRLCTPDQNTCVLFEHPIPYLVPCYCYSVLFWEGTRCWRMAMEI